ncbi:alpha/beta hydrolase [Pseudomonas sp. 2835]|uniref:alpha/beta hydrolase n=1 Tax=Pseudomonas sp. 2835 TaxID=3156451 RepID=UPI003D1B5BC1
MSLHPDLSAFLELAEFGRLTGKSQPLHELPLAKARADFEATSQILDPNPPGELQVSSLQLPTRDGAAIDARLYRSNASVGKTLPVIVYFHGGGYVVGSLDSHDSVCRRLALSGEFAVLAPAYRLAPEYRFPIAVEDAADSLTALAGQAGALHLDSRRVVLAGDSAGATLATVLAAMAASGALPQALRPVAQLLFYPVTDISQVRASHQRYAEGYLLESATLEWFYQHYARTPADRLDWRASPLLGNAVAQAPAYVALAGYDPLHDEGLAYAQWLQAAGTEVALSIEAGLSHDFLRMGGIVAQVEQVYARALAWLGQVLER